MANRIILLDDNTANRIAAGEVVERPASAVKELVENAIDAGATQILVSLEEGGKRRIEVVDNGCGMGAEDAVLSLQRHATSKIRSADDLFAIQTLGFRGEALPSIASVSHFTLTSRAAGEATGTRIIVHGGEMEKVEEVGGRGGTSVIVEDLFYNTPARLKFLKSTPTELSRALEVIGHLAISHPHISFHVRSGGQEILSTPGSGEPLGALAAVWGRDIARKLIPIRHDTAGLSVTGFVCTPDVTRPGRSHEIFFVNRRPIRSRLLNHALEDALRELTPESRYPIAVLFIEIAPDLVDVNVHPTKTEVKFTRDGDVHHAASQAIKSALLAYGIVPEIRVESRQGRGESIVPAWRSVQTTFSGVDFETLARAAAEVHPPVAEEARTEEERETRPTEAGIAAEGETLPPSLPPLAPNATEHAQNTFHMCSAGWRESAAIRQRSVPTSLPPRPFAEQLRGFRVLGQARNTYIIAITDQGIAIIDQHVAHERVLYERLTVKRREQGIPAQRLAVPFTLSLGAAESALLQQRLEDFAAAGWEIEPFGRGTFLVRSVPSYAAKRSHESLLRDMIDELANLSVARRLLVQREHVTITNACKMAVKAGDPLTMEEMVGLLDQLADTENPYLCPHGRPIVVTIPFHEIDRKFKRA